MTEEREAAGQTTLEGEHRSPFREVRRHLLKAQKEMLLATRALLEAYLEKKEASRAERGKGREPARKVEIK